MHLFKVLTEDQELKEVPLDTNGTYRGDPDFPETTSGCFLGLSNYTAYDSCPKPECFNKKLVDDQCPSCMAAVQPTPYGYCKVLMEVEGEIKSYTMFHRELSSIIGSFDPKLCENDICNLAAANFQGTYQFLEKRGTIIYITKS